MRPGGILGPGRAPQVRQPLRGGEGGPLHILRPVRLPLPQRRAQARGGPCLHPAALPPALHRTELRQQRVLLREALPHILAVRSSQRDLPRPGRLPLDGGHGAGHLAHGGDRRTDAIGPPGQPRRLRRRVRPAAFPHPQGREHAQGLPVRDHRWS